MKLTKMTTKLTQEPIAFQISFRLNQLNDYYGKGDVFRHLYEIETDNYLSLHIQNLVLTYGQDAVKRMSEVIYAKQIKTTKAS